MSKAEHPKQHNVTVLMTNGKTINIKTSWGKEGDKLTLDTDPFKHIAWKDGKDIVIEKSSTERSKKFEKFDSFF